MVLVKLHKSFLTCGAVLAGLLGVAGCGPGETPATLEPGTGANPLDGATISDDGNTLTFKVSEDGTSLEEVLIDTPEGTERVAFDDAAESDGVAIPREIETAAGNSFAFNRNTNSAQITTTLPLQTASTTFNVDLDENPFQLNARGVKQEVEEGDCAAIRDSVDEFCDYYQENAESSKDELIEVATELVLAEVDESLAPFVPGVVSAVITDFFDTLTVVCNGWTQMREGTETTPQTDPCDSL